MHVLVSCKNKEDSIKNEGARVFATFLPLLVNGEFFRRSRAANFAEHGLIWLYLELRPDFMVVLVTCKIEEDSVKNEELECSQHYTLIFQMPKCSLLRNLCWDLAEIRTHPSFYSCSRYLQE